MSRKRWYGRLILQHGMYTYIRTLDYIVKFICLFRNRFLKQIKVKIAFFKKWDVQFDVAELFIIIFMTYIPS